ncbi:hypothetical protein [Paenibacillus sp. FSL R10-2734]|uniref:hypothetical protein n=1 Tax=Paenibacillus sp. FSL R10-2734 TaxID=2954691 RepID=UPI0030DCA227
MKIIRLGIHMCRAFYHHRILSDDFQTAIESEYIQLLYKIFNAISLYYTIRSFSFQTGQVLNEANGLIL